MANEKTDRKNSRPRRTFKGRSDRYVEEFRWGFVHGEESEDKTEDEVSEKKPFERKPQQKSAEHKSASRKPDERKPEGGRKAISPKPAPVKRDRKPQLPKTVSRPARPAVDDFSADDLNLPSYGRTPVPRSSDLPAVSPSVSAAVASVQPSKPMPNRSSSSKLPEKPVKPRQANTRTTPRRDAPQRDTLRKDIPQRDTQQDRPKQSEPQRVPRKPDSPPPLVQSPAYKEQMVWDADKRDYVPLVVFKSPAAPKPFRRDETPVESKTPNSEAPRRDAAKDAVKDAVKEAVKTVKKPLPAESDKNRPDRNRKDAPSEHKHREPQRRANVPPMSGTAITGEKPDAGNIEVEASGFVKLGVSDTMLEALKLLRFVEPTPIQAGVFEQVKAGLDIMGQAQTGTGKTAAFCIPIIEAVEDCPPGNDPVAMILVPTRELAVQVRDEAVKLAYGREVRITACYGGKPLAKQIERLKNGVDMIIGTPGRILDLMNRRALSLDLLRWVVLDEADRMLDIGFRPDIEKILRRTPKERQTLLFSATLAPPVVKLAEKYMKEPIVLDFSNKNIAVDTIEQFYVTVDPQRKFDALVHLLKEQEPQQAIIFTRTKRGADRLARLLASRFDSLAAIHGDLAQNVRDQVMGKFRSGTLRYLVATDVVGRGIDVSGISHIINYDIPAFCDDYVHRVGRTGRMGREGIAFTFVTVAEGSELTRIEMRINKLLKRAELKGFEAFTKPVATPEELAAEDAQAAAAEPSKPVFGKMVRKVRRAL